MTEGLNPGTILLMSVKGNYLTVNPEREGKDEKDISDCETVG